MQISRMTGILPGRYSQWRLISLLLIALLLHFEPFAQYWYPRVKPVTSDKIPSLYNRLKKSKPDTTRVNILLDLANAVTHRIISKPYDLDSSIYFADSARRLSERLRFRRGNNTALLLLMDAYTALDKFREADELLPKVAGDTAKTDLLILLAFRRTERSQEGTPEFEQAFLYFQQAKKLAEKNHLRESAVMINLYLGTMCLSRDDPNKEKILLQIADQYKAINYPYLHYIYYQLSSLHAWLGNSDKTLLYAREAVKTVEMSRDTSAAADIYVNYAWVNQRVDEYQTALDYAYKAIEMYKILPGLFPVEDFISIVAKTLRKMQRYEEALAFITRIQKEFPPADKDQELTYLADFANIYRDMKQYGNAEIYYLRMEELAKKENLINSPELYQSLAQLYVESHRYEKAKPYLDKLKEYPRSDFNKGAWRHLLYMRFLTDSATGNYLSAIQYQNQFNSLDELQLREAREKEVKRLSVQFETEKKVNEIKLKDQDIRLLQQTARLRETKLSQARQLRNFTIAGIVMLLIITILLYRQYRQKQKNIAEITEVNAIIEQKSLAIAEKNEKLEQLVEEKEWLLKEVHHRVKNNLHTVLCLLESQASYLKDEALAAIKASQHRIYAMSVIHQKLYQSDTKEIEMAPYIHQLTQNLRDSFDTSEKIHFQLDIGNVTLSASQAIPVALIINEAVTNTIKYAFPGDAKGEMSISLHRSDHIIRLALADNGIGIDPKLANREAGSIGIELIKGLSKEIHAQLQIYGDNGTRIEVVFAENMLSQAGQPGGGERKTA